MSKRKMSRKRHYRGQAHTDQGRRGKQIVEGLTIRDIADCFIRGIILASSHLIPEKYEEARKGEAARLDSNDLFGFNLDQVDMLAASQNMTCEIERMMGIYPNITNVKFEVCDE